MDWSLASNEAIPYRHKGNVTRSRELGIIGIAAALNLDETEKSKELGNHIPETNPVLSVKSDDESSKGQEHKILVASGKEYEENEEVEDDGKKIKSEDSNEPQSQIIKANLVISLPPVKESQDADKSESDDGDDESNVEELIILNCKEQYISDVTVEDDSDDVKEIIQDDSSICCHSDTSNNSISSFTFPILHNEDGSVKTLSLEAIWNVCDKQLELSQPQTQPQLQFYFIPATHTHTITQLPPQTQRKSSLSKQSSETQSQKAFSNRWFSCFYCICQHD